MRKKGERFDLVCPECGALMKLRSSRYGLFYGCTRWPACKAKHGAHPDGAPLGVPGDKRTKAARIKAHEYFDPLWQEAFGIPDYGDLDERGEKAVRRRARVRAYQWLAEQLGVDEVHIGEADVDLCARIADLCAPMSPEEIRDWAKERGL